MSALAVDLPVRLGDLARLLHAELLGDANLTVSRIAPLDSAGSDAVSFLANPRYQAQLARTGAACVIVAPALADLASARGAALVCNDPYLAYARLSQWWARRQRPRPQPGIHPAAVIDTGVMLGVDVHVGALAHIGAGARIGDGAVISAQAHVGAGAEVGADTVLRPLALLGEACSIGARGLLHGGVVIGADGFGFAPEALPAAAADAGRSPGAAWIKIEQLGAVRIGDDVEIGANSCVDRGALDDTVIEDGVKLDNLVQIGHNVRIGAHSAFAGCVGVAGSARIGRHCTAGGGAIILGHLEIVDHVHITAATVVSRSIRKPGQYSGMFPFDENANWEKNAATLRQLHTLRDRIRALEGRG